MLLTNPWLEVPRPRPLATGRLFCFPHAGAGSAPYRTWLPEVSDRCEVVIVTLPGRDRRGREALLTRMSDFLQDAVPALLPMLDLPFAFFGHSMGAVLAFETARELRRRGAAQPYRLFLSGRAPETSGSPIHTLPDSEFLRVLGERYNGIPAELAADPEMLRAFLPILRSDLTLLETHEVREHPPLDCPITALGGRQDSQAGAAQLQGWARQTTGSLDVLIFSGGHFFLFDQRSAVLACLRPRLEPSWEGSRALVFPGQGSQHKGMGKELFDQFPDLVERADQILGYSLRDLCLRDSESRLRQTRYTQPALFAVNAMTYLASDRKAEYLAGHSLGEYNALWAAGAFDFETGLRLVQKRGELMARATDGGMLAVLGLDAGSLTDLLERHGPEVDLANDNSAEQLVLSGPVAALQGLTPVLQEAGARVVKLNVSAAFHSRYMAAAAAEFASFLKEFSLQDPRQPVLSNVTGLPYAPGQVRELLAEQIRRPVRWTESMRYLLVHGVTDLREIGPGQVLSRLWLAARETFQQDTPLRQEEGPLREPPSPVDRKERTLVSLVEPSRPEPSAIHELEEPRDSDLGQSLGSGAFRARYRLRLAYLAGSSRGAGSVETALRLAGAGLMGVLGGSGLSPEQVAARLLETRRQLPSGAPLALALLHSPENPELEMALALTATENEVDVLEVSGFLQPRLSLLMFRFAGCAERGEPRLVLARVARPDVASELVAPPSSHLLEMGLREGLLSPEDARVAVHWPLVSELCADPEGGGLTGSSSWAVLLPCLKAEATRARQRHGFSGEIFVGACGGMGSPEALAAAFFLGADFVMTTGINSCTPQSPLCPEARDLLAKVGVGDTTYAPAWETFELGGRMEVVRRGTLFAARAHKLQDIYRRGESLEALSESDRKWLEKHLLRTSIAEAWSRVQNELASVLPQALAAAADSPRLRLSLLCKWYLWSSLRAAHGSATPSSDFAIPCDSEMGALNEWLKGTPLQPWSERHVDVLAQRLMTAAARRLAPNQGPSR